MVKALGLIFYLYLAFFAELHLLFNVINDI